MNREIENLYTWYSAHGTVSTDTRKIVPGSVFFALKGDKYDANAFAREALEKGASHVVIDDEKYKVDERCTVVDNVLETLQQLATFHRSQLKIPVIGLTGSNGKTTTKELMNAVLQKKFRTLATKGNLNNHIGVPLTVLSIDPTVTLAIVEMGANHIGEIALLCKIANPTHGLITNIGKAHIGTFGGYENIVKAKSELYRHLERTNGIAFVNSRDPLLTDLAQSISEQVRYPASGDFYHAELMSADPLVRVRTESGAEVQTQLIGGYNFDNIACALCAGKFFGVDPVAANEAVAAYAPENMRSQVLKRNTNTIILDAYNANPSSMEAAIANMAGLKAENKVLILGDMFELEEQAMAEHRAIGSLIKQKGFTNVYLCGTLFNSALQEIPEAKYFPEKDALVTHLKKHPITDSTILVKASRGIGLETIIAYL